MNKLLFSLCFSTIAVVCHSQVKDDNIVQKESPFTASLELSSKYMWRGIEYGTAPVAFPMLAYNYEGLNVFAMGAYAFDGSHQEVDFGLSYSYKNYFTIGLADYYYPSSVGSYDKYFDFRNKSTGHSVEAYATLTPLKLPFWLTISTYVYGADKNLEGKQAFSSYAELGYTFAFDESNALSFAVGANLNRGFYTDYEYGFNVVNASIKYATAFKLGNFILPVSASYIFNPFKNKGYFTISLYFNS